MISTAREQLWSILLGFSERYPQWRFGQMVTNIAGWVANEAWATVDDERLVQIAREHLNRRFGNEPIQRSWNSNGTRQALLDAFCELLMLDPRAGIVQAVNQMAQRAQVNVYDIEDEQLLEAVKNELEQRKNAGPSAEE
jgi:hypothetical protein